MLAFMPGKVRERQCDDLEAPCIVEPRRFVRQHVEQIV